MVILLEWIDAKRGDVQVYWEFIKAQVAIYGYPVTLSSTFTSSSNSTVVLAL